MKSIVTVLLATGAVVCWVIAYAFQLPAAAALAAALTLAAAASVLVATLTRVTSTPAPGVRAPVVAVNGVPRLTENRTPAASAPTPDASAPAAPIPPEMVAITDTSTSAEVPVVAENSTPAPLSATADSAAGEVSATPAPADAAAFPVDEAPNLDPRSLVRQLLDVAATEGRPLASHAWLLDHASGTFRLVAADGALAPTDEPMDADDPILGRATEENASVIQKLRRFVSPTEQTTIWRYAFPISHDGIPGVAAIDLGSETEPSRVELDRRTSAIRVGLISALALHIANGRTASSRVLIDASRELSRRLNPDGVVTAILEHTVALADAATASIMLLDEDGSRLQVIASRGLPCEVADSTISVGEGIAGWVAASGQPLLVEDIPGHATRGQRHGVRSAMSVPIADDDGLLGVLNVGSRSYPACFTQYHLEELELLGRQAAVAYRNALAVTTTNELFFDSLKALALAIETKDPYAAGATERVMEHAAAIGRAMRLMPSEQRGLEIAAMLHDIGMASLVDGMGACARPLTTVERGLLKMHPVVAADILERTPALKTVAAVVYHHHEHFDGSGYASGVAGEDIPLGARILAVVDAYVAMTSDRPYRRALSHAQAVAELADKAGTQFDPEVVEAFLSLHGSESDRVPDRR